MNQPVSTNRWAWWVFSGVCAAFLALFLLSGSPSVQAGSATNTPTGSITASSGATATSERSALISPTPKVAPAILTLRAMNATAMNFPTWTPGPSAIVFDGKFQMLDFNAGWCAPCQAMKPYVRTLSAKYAGKMTFWDLNIDNPSSNQLSRKYRVQFIPLIVILDPTGKVAARIEGYQTETELESTIKQALGTS